MNNIRVLLMLALAGMFIPLVSQAQNGQADEPFTTFVADDPATDENTESEDLISVAFDAAPLSTVVQVFTRWSGANIIATPSNLTGTVTVNLEDVAWRPALRSILEMHNLTLIESVTGSDVYSIVPIEPGAPPPMIIETIRLKYAPVDDVVAVLQPLLTSGGTLSPLASRNIVVMRATEDAIARMKLVIADVDIPREQVYIEAKFIEISDKAERSVGINWQLLKAYQIDGDLGYSYNDSRTDNRSDNLQRDFTDSTTRGESTGRQYDIDGSEFESIAAAPVSGIVGGGPFGTDGALPVPTTTFSLDKDSSDSTAAQFLKSTTRNITDLRSATFDPVEFNLIISALEEQDGVSIISNPKIIVANEEEARIHIGDREPNIRGTVTAGQQGQANTVTYELDESEPYFEFGITLDVRPTINTSSNITLNITPVLSRRLDTKIAPDGNTFPVTSQREIQTVFSLDSGRTAAIGGLTTTTERLDHAGIPVLSKIPLVGRYLFNHESDVADQQETVIFVTVGLANPESIGENVGLPSETYLSRKKRIQRQRLKRDQDKEIDELQKALDEANKREADRAASLLDKKS